MPYGDRTAAVRCQILQNRTAAVRLPYDFYGHHNSANFSNFFLNTVNTPLKSLSNKAFGRFGKYCFVNRPKATFCLMKLSQFSQLKYIISHRRYAISVNTVYTTNIYYNKNKSFGIDSIFLRFSICSFFLLAEKKRNKKEKSVLRNYEL